MSGFTKIIGVAVDNVTKLIGINPQNMEKMMGVAPAGGDDEGGGDEGEGAGLEESGSGTLVGNASLSSGVLSLDGNGDYFRIPDADNLDPAGGNFTVRFWFNAASFPSNSNDNIINKIAPWKGYAITLSTSTNIGGTNLSAGGISFYTNHVSYGGGSHKGVVPSGGISLNTWHHVAVTINSSTSQFKIYFDGSPELTYTATLPQSTSAELWVGAGRTNASSNPGLYFHGQVDQLFVTQQLLSDSEISNIYNAGR